MEKSEAVAVKQRKGYMTYKYLEHCEVALGVLVNGTVLHVNEILGGFISNMVLKQRKVVEQHVVQG